jgi:hypothetical protein
MWTVTFSVLDGKGKSGSFSLNFPTARTIAQIESWVSGVATPLNGILAGAVTAISIARSMAIPLALASTPQDTSDVEEKMLTIARSVAGFTTKFAVPAIDEDIVAIGTSAIDQADANVILLNLALETGIDVGGTMVQPSDNRGSEIDLITSQNEVFASSTGS